MNTQTSFNANTLPHRLAAVPLYDSECDVTDVWLEECDPENETGATCIAYFEHHKGTFSGGSFCDFTADVPTLVAIAATEGDETFIYPAWSAIDFLGADAVKRIEKVQCDEWNGF